MYVGINHITVVVQDKNEAENFYCKVLGLKKVEIGNSLWVRVGNQFIHINENSKALRVVSFCHFAIEVNDLLLFLRELIEKGVDVFDIEDNISKIDVNTNLTKKNRNYFIEDPFGNLIEFFDSSNKFFKQ
jgi:catechol 2,3-dioxygenase-like lactoylglutathione lyase family enzyme